RGQARVRPGVDCPFAGRDFGQRRGEALCRRPVAGRDCARAVRARRRGDRPGLESRAVARSQVAFDGGFYLAMSLDRFFNRWDARYGIPRPMSALHLDPYQAGLRLLRDVGEGAALLLAGCASALIWWKVADLLLRIGVETHDYMIFAVI